MSLPGDIPCMTPCQNISCPYCAFGVCMDNATCADRRTEAAKAEAKGETK